MNNFNLSEISREDLLLLQDKVKRELKRFRPYRIRERLVKCGNVECWCDDGDDLHGPYLYVVYRDGGKTKSISLGPKLEIWEMTDNMQAYPDITDYLFTPDHKYEALPAGQVQGWLSTTLSVVEFKERYGCTKEEDNFGRADKFWGTSEDYARYRTEIELYQQRRQIPYSPWAGYGVGTLEAIAKLTWLEKRGYYQKA